MTKAKAAAHPTQAAAPVVEPEAHEEPVPGAEAAPLPAPPVEADAPLPLAENMVYGFKPGSGITTMDLREILLMGMMHLVNGPADIAKGALRGQTLPGHRFDQLSDNAQRWFEAINQAPPEA